MGAFVFLGTQQRYLMSSSVTAHSGTPDAEQFAKRIIQKRGDEGMFIEGRTQPADDSATFNSPL